MRIINDYHRKQKELVYDEFMSKEFYDKIKSVREMYAFLYEKGILKEVSFEYRDDAQGTTFALDADKLEPYREEMINSGTYMADLAVYHILDAEYTPCVYCGSLELSWTMMTYRDNCGCIGRSWECGMCKALRGKDLCKVSEVEEEKGVKVAVSKLWDIIYGKERNCQSTTHCLKAVGLRKPIVD